MEAMGDELEHGHLRIGDSFAFRVSAAIKLAAHTQPRRRARAADQVQRVVAQTRARVLRGDTHFPGKGVSLFEAHTEIIRKGKLAKPTEFGRLVKIQEAEAQFITDYEVCEPGQP